MLSCHIVSALWSESADNPASHFEPLLSSSPPQTIPLFTVSVDNMNMLFSHTRCTGNSWKESAPSGCSIDGELAPDVNGSLIVFLYLKLWFSSYLRLWYRQQNPTFTKVTCWLCSISSVVYTYSTVAYVLYLHTGVHISIRLQGNEK